IAKSTTYSSIQYPDEDNDLYSQIPVRDLPEAVKDVIKEAYPDRTMAEAYIKVDGNYKVIVKTKEGKNPAYIIHQEVLL
ncbi:MAG: hypothetical protein LIO65_02730, partial [Odoribacter sp.]|nr:hypothetical protein [Odoribacter sp.]